MKSLRYVSASAANSVFDANHQELPGELNQLVVNGVRRNESKNRSDLMHVNAGGICHQ
jgi:hypothetical protein